MLVFTGAVKRVGDPVNGQMPGMETPAYGIANIAPGLGTRPTGRRRANRG